jgi:hypothetical protein
VFVVVSMTDTVSSLLLVTSTSVPHTSMEVGCSPVGIVAVTCPWSGPRRRRSPAWPSRDSLTMSVS